MSLLQGKFIGSIFEQEIPSGTVNGSNVVFTLSTTPHSAKAVMVTIDGLILRQASDYSMSGSQITMVTAPVIGQQLYVFYIQK
jgi:hypothetical protein